MGLCEINRHEKTELVGDFKNGDRLAGMSRSPVMPVAISSRLNSIALADGGLLSYRHTDIKFDRGPEDTKHYRMTISCSRYARRAADPRRAGRT
jgi:hypothetical protein